jgi:hypothetical protein
LEPPTKVHALLRRPDQKQDLNIGQDDQRSDEIVLQVERKAAKARISRDSLKPKLRIRRVVGTKIALGSSS